MIGLVNFLAYGILYGLIWGEAVNGRVVDDGGQLRYFLQKGREVTRGVFIYSGIHSISIPLTVGAVMLAMLTLAKERITSSMRSAIVRGRTFITILAVVIGILVVIWTVGFTHRFSDKLSYPEKPVVTNGLTHHSLEKLSYPEKPVPSVQTPEQ